MVRGQINQSSAFDSSGHSPFAHRRKTQEIKAARASKLGQKNRPVDLPVRVKPVNPESTSNTYSNPTQLDQEQSAADIKPSAIELVKQLLQPAEGKARPPVKISQKEPSNLFDRIPKHWHWHMVWIGTLGLFGGVGLSAYFWLASLPPLPDCKTTTPLSADSHRLYCAQEMARSGKLEDLLAGIALVKNWSPTHPLYRDAQQSLAKWSRLVMLAARDKMNQNDFKGAIDTISKIPQTSPVYEEAQKTSAQWQEQWKEGELIYTQAVEAMKQQNWREAFDYVTELGYLEHDYWRLQQADELAKRIFVQKESYEALKQAKKLAKNVLPEHLGEAITLLQTVAPESDAWTEAQMLLVEWSQNLLQRALLDWQEGNTAAAIQLAHQVPLNLKLSAEAQDLVRYSHAHKLVEDSKIEAKLSWRQLWSLWEATTAVKQIQPASLIYADAQDKLQDWQTQLQDLQQLQFANVIAGFKQKPMLEYAIAQANQIPPERQRHSQAQAMVADWMNRIEQLEDQPYLQLAQQFAETNLIPDLQLAIAQAQVIPSHRSLWTEVQTQIVVWQQQIQRLEDQPILDKAIALAKQSKWDEAITVAAEIRPDRSLSEQAQAAIATWKDKIREAEVAQDQSVLEQARSFAGRGQLTDAIATANQLSPGRPLYLEAQASIGAWLRERDGDLKSGTEATGSTNTTEHPLDAASELPATDSAESPEMGTEDLTGASVEPSVEEAAEPEIEE